MAIIKSQARLQRKQHRDAALGLAGAADASDSSDSSSSASSASDSEPDQDFNSDPEDQPIPTFPGNPHTSIQLACQNPTFPSPLTPHVTLCIICLNKEFRTPEAVALHLQSSVHRRSAGRFERLAGSGDERVRGVTDARVLAFLAYRDAQVKRAEGANSSGRQQRARQGAESQPKVPKDPEAKKAAKAARILKKKAAKAAKKARRLDRKSAGVKAAAAPSAKTGNGTKRNKDKYNNGKKKADVVAAAAET